MGIPFKLKFMNTYNDGVSYMGETSEITLPKMTRILEDYRGGGMDAAIGIDLGGEPTEIEWKIGGLVPQVYSQFGNRRLDGVMLRWVGSYEDDSSGQTKTADITVRGRHSEIDPGSAKAGSDTEQTVKTRCVYYKLMIDGRTVIEKDDLNMVFIVNGVDLLAEHRRNLGN